MLKFFNIKLFLSFLPLEKCPPPRYIEINVKQVNIETEKEGIGQISAEIFHHLCQRKEEMLLMDVMIT